MKEDARNRPGGKNDKEKRDLEEEWESNSEDDEDWYDVFDDYDDDDDNGIYSQDPSPVVAAYNG